MGNGRLGACVFGNPSAERIQLNEDSIWDGEHHDLSDMMSVPMPCYQTLDDLHLRDRIVVLCKSFAFVAA